MMPLSHGLYTLMKREGFACFVVSAIATASLKGSAIGVTCEGGMSLLFVYITALGCWLSDAAGSTSVHEWCIGDDFVYGDQYCSCSIKIEHCFVSGSLRILCVRSLLL